MNGAGGVNEIWGKDGGEREIGGGGKKFLQLAKRERGKEER